MEYNKLSDKELATVVMELINRLSALEQKTGDYLQRHHTSDMDAYLIRQEYAEIKDELKEMAHYARLDRNRNGSELYRSNFVRLIQEASAFGMTVRKGGKIDQKLFSAISTAKYKLSKFVDWKEIAESD